MTLSKKISLVTGSLTTSIILLMGFILMQQWFHTLNNQLLLEAQDLSTMVSQIDQIQMDLIKENGFIPIQKKCEQIRLQSRIQYIYIIGKNKKFYSHISPHLLGAVTSDPFYLKHLTTMRQGSQMTIKQKSNISEACTPIYYRGEPVGLAVVGLLSGRIFQEIHIQIILFSLYVILAIYFGLYSGIWLARSIKKSIYNLEPREISQLLNQRALILENIEEGLITIDKDGFIIFINRAAKHFLDLSEKDIDQPIIHYNFKEGFFSVLKKKDPIIKEIKTSNGKILEARFQPLFDEISHSFMGVTALLEDLTIIREKAEELIGVKQLNEGFRAQNHEFLNKLHTISGLIQLEEYNEAINFISQVQHNRREIIHSLSSKIKDPRVAALLLGKYNKAQELKINFILNESSFLSRGHKQVHLINLILGNLIENSLEALVQSPLAYIKLLLSETPNNGFIIEIENNGPQIPQKELKNIFLKGFSSKGEERGMGLYLIYSDLIQQGGEILVNSDLNKTQFIATLQGEKDEYFNS